MTKKEKNILEQALYKATLMELRKKEAMKNDKSKNARKRAEGAAAWAQAVESLFRQLLPKEAEERLKDLKKEAANTFELEKG